LRSANSIAVDCYRSLSTAIGNSEDCKSDLLSKVAFDTFQKEGVALDHIHRIEGVNTAVGVVHLIPSGDKWV